MKIKRLKMNMFNENMSRKSIFVLDFCFVKGHQLFDFLYLENSEKVKVAVAVLSFK